MTAPTAVITGAAKGIGAGLARAAARRYPRIVVADVDVEGTQALVDELGGDDVEVVSVEADVTDLDSVHELAARACDGGQVALLVNNAGVESAGLAWERPAQWQRVIDVNLGGVYHCLHVFVPLMLESAAPSTVINVGSLGAFMTAPHHAAYQVSKAGLLALSRSLASDLEAVGSSIKVVTALPGSVATTIADAVEEPNDPASLSSLSVIRQALSEYGISADHAGELIIAAAADGASYVTTDPQMAAAVIQEHVRNTCAAAAILTGEAG